jgi:hypothetical protein
MQTRIYRKKYNNDKKMKNQMRRLFRPISHQNPNPARQTVLLNCGYIAGLEKTRVFLKKTSPVGFFGFFWVFLGFLGFFGFFWVFFAQMRWFIGFFSVSRILLGASRL